MTTTISSRIPTDIIQHIDSIAKTTERSRSFHIKKALELYCVSFDNNLTELPSQSTQTALSELKTKKGKTFANVNELFADLDS